MNITIQDILRATLAFLFFPLVIVIPGYMTAWALNLFNFRQRQSVTRLGIGLVVSFAVSPILFNLTSSLISVNFSVFILGAFAVGFAITIFRGQSIAPADAKPYIKTILWIGGAWAVFVILSLVDIEWKDHLYYSVVSFDQSTRVAIIEAMTRTGVPAINPSYYPGHPVRLTFVYYFWYTLGSLIDLLGGKAIDAHAALNASSAWSGLGLLALVALYLRQRNVSSARVAWRQALTGISLLVVSGLDVIAIIMLFAGDQKIVGSIDVWNTWIPSWAASTLWVPHHVAAMIAGLSAILLAQSARGQSTSRQFEILTIAGMAFASALGLSVYVTFVFVIFWIIWLLAILRQKSERYLVTPMVFAGVTAILLASPFLIGLIQGNGEPSQFPIAFEIRSFLQLESIVKAWSPLARSLTMLAALPINYMLELGFFFIAGLYWFKVKDKKTLSTNSFYLAEILLLAIVVIIASTLRSTVIPSNDLGWRAWLPGQFVLLIWGTDVIESLALAAKPVSQKTGEPQKIKKLLVVFISVGILTTIVDAILLRIAWPIMTGEETAQRYYSGHLAYEYLRDHISRTTIVQNNPADVLNPDRPSGLYGTKQMVVSNLTGYGVPKDKYRELVDEVKILFVNKNADWQFIDQGCHAYSIDVLIVNDTDPIWHNLATLEAQRPALYKNTHYALLACNDYAQPSEDQ